MKEERMPPHISVGAATMSFDAKIETENSDWRLGSRQDSSMIIGDNQAKYRRKSIESETKIKMFNAPSIISPA
jgi:hypothetical protein